MVTSEHSRGGEVAKQASARASGTMGIRRQHRPICWRLTEATPTPQHTLVDADAAGNGKRPTPSLNKRGKRLIVVFFLLFELGVVAVDGG